MVCERCGSPLHESDFFCGRCGLQVVTAAAPLPPPVPAPPPDLQVTRAQPVVYPPLIARRRQRPAALLPLLVAFGFVALVVAVVAIVIAARDHDARLTESTEPTTAPTVTLLDGSLVPLPTTVTTLVPVPVTAPLIDATTVVATTTPVTASTAVVVGPVSSTDPTNATGATTTTQATTTVVPAGSSIVPAVQSVSATSVRSNSFDSCGAPTSYPASNAADGDLDTAWMAPGDATGQSLTVTLAASARVTRVGLVPGYAKVDPCTGVDRFTQLRRISKVRWTFAGGANVTQTLDVDDRSMQYIDVSPAVGTTTVTMTILATTDPENPGLDHTPISEIGIT